MQAAKKRAAKGRGTKAPLPTSLVAAMMIFLEWRASMQARGPERAQTLRDRAWLGAGFCGLLRKSELCGPRRGDVRERPNQRCWTLYIKRSEMDPGGHEAFVT